MGAHGKQDPDFIIIVIIIIVYWTKVFQRDKFYHIRLVLPFYPDFEKWAKL